MAKINIKMKRVFFFFVFAVVFASCSQNSVPTHTVIQPKEFQQVISKGNIQLIDVRTPQEFSEGIISGAVNIDYKADDFEQKIKELDKSETVYLYCLGGGRSAQAAEILVQNGYTVVELEGGVMNWRNNDLPMEGANQKNDEISNFGELIQSDEIVVVDFYAEWCVPCKKMKPSLDKLDEVDGVTVIRVNADLNPALSKREQVTALPVLQYYKNGKLIKREEGFASEEKLFSNIKSL